VLGSDHPSVLTSPNNLAHAYHTVGDVSRAIPLYERTLADRERVLGPDHPDTLASRNNLAYAYHTVGDVGMAIPLFERTLADRERVLGPDHLTRWPPATTSPAPPMARVTWAGRSRSTRGPSPTASGCSAPTTPARWPPATTSPTLTTLRVTWAGRSRSASGPFAERERVLGPDQQSTLASRNNLARANQAHGYRSDAR
jgi:hypothetical protein